MFLDSLIKGLESTFITEDRYLLFLNGLKATLIITIAAAAIGIAIGILVAVIKVYHYNTGKMKILNAVMMVYTTIIRGTPVVVQLMIWCYIVFVSVRDGVTIAIIGFGLNSGAYASEIIRAGIMSIDKGQSEAGRSLGLPESTTMASIILPQAVKNILPALFNEFITLLKETSIVGYVAVTDLTLAANLVRSRTADAIVPLLSIAVIYLILVIGLTFLQNKLEKRLARSDRR